MRISFYTLFLADRSARMKMYGTAWLVSAGVGTMLMLLGVAVEQSVIVTISVAIAILAAWTAVYCSSLPHVVAQGDALSFGRRAMLAGASLLLTAVLGLSNSKMEAATLSNRLRKHIEKQPIEPSDLKAIDEALAIARKNKIHVDAGVIRAVGTALSQTNENPASATASPSAYQVIAQAAALRSELARNAKSAPSSIRQTHRFPPYSLFDHSYIHNLQFALDNEVFSDSSIRDCTVIYDGGPLILRNTEFINCEFLFSEAPAARQLLLLFTERDDPDFRFWNTGVPIPH